MEITPYTLPSGHRTKAAPTLQLPARLGGARFARVEVSADGRWGFFAAAEDELGSGIYLVDLTAPDQFERVAAGSCPRWAKGKRSEK